MNGTNLNATDALRFIFAGKATLTVAEPHTGARYTYKVEAPKDADPARPVLFVKLLNGPDNWTNYRYMGAIFGAGAAADFRLTRKSCAGPDAPSVRLFSAALAACKAGSLDATRLQVWHEGKCGRCGRKLTVPSSIATGIGPECAAVMGIAMVDPSKVAAPVAAPAPMVAATVAAPAPVVPVLDPKDVAIARAMWTPGVLDTLAPAVLEAAVGGSGRPGLVRAMLALSMDALAAGLAA